MKSIRHPFIALIAALLLVFAQQGALAHMIGHSGVGGESHLQQGENNHGAALSLSHICTTCVAFAALDAYLPTVALPTGSADDHFLALTVAALAAQSNTPLHQRARAPPHRL